METSFLIELTMYFHLIVLAKCERKKTIIYSKRGMIEDFAMIENDSLRCIPLKAK